MKKPDRSAVPAENSDPAILMMQSAKNRNSGNPAADLNRTREWRILVQRQVSSRFVVVANVIFQDLTQMCLAQDDDVVHTFTPDRSDQPFGKAVLPGRGGCGRLVPDAHGTQSPCDDHTVDAIPVPDHVARSRVPGECLGDLSRDPFGGRMCRDIDPDKISAV